MAARLLYVADPMCSWCWGFRPVLEEIEARSPHVVQYVMGGLAPDSDEPMPESTRAYVRDAWRSVEKATGASFNHDFWTSCEPRRSTYPACRAVLAAELQRPDAGRALFQRIQRAYYLEARNPSDASTLVELAEEESLDPRELAAALDSDEVQQLLERDFVLRDRIGATGFPSIAVSAGGRERLVVRGYEPLESILPRLAAAGVLS